MDVYGAFQICAIGVVAAPVTAVMSRTYKKHQGAELIFIWSSLILAGKYSDCQIRPIKYLKYIDNGMIIGMMSLVVEFYRIRSIPCARDQNGNTISSDPRKFPYGTPGICNITCNETAGPLSPIRGGSANNIDVIPAPHRFTFGMATVLAAACCILTILLLMKIWFNILEENAKERRAHEEKKSQENASGATSDSDSVELRELSRGRRGTSANAETTLVTTESSERARQNSRQELTDADKYRDNKKIMFFRNFFGVPLSGAAILAILIIGERNLFSYSVLYMTEPMPNVGK
jgi:hypothetical protein